MAFNWVCPHCNRPQTVTENRFSLVKSGVGVGDVAGGPYALERTSIGCANPDCNKITISIRIGEDNGLHGNWMVKRGTEIFSQQIVPRGQAKPQPSFIPVPLVEDYTEACLIRDLSPKASATLARRCLQGMIRDFAGIAKRRLIDEINSLKAAVEDGTADRAVTAESIAAIDHVRSLGNIGAHMEANIDLIVPVDAGEAQAMIELIEMLFDEWYGARARRNQRLAKIAEIRAGKDEIKRGVESSQASSEA